MLQLNMTELLDLAKEYAPKGTPLTVGLLIKGFYANKPQKDALLSATFPRSDRQIQAVEICKAGTIIVSSNTASGFTRDRGNQPGFTDLRDALIGKVLGKDECKRRGVETGTRQQGLLKRLGINGVKEADIVFLKSE